MPRNIIKDAKKIIIKIGSRVLLEENGKPNYALIKDLVGQIAHLKKAQKEVIFVTSGAIGTGMEALGLRKKPKDMPSLQACAALGQVRLMGTYEQYFAQEGCKIAQVLLTHEDLKVRKRHLNIKHTFRALLENGVIPIVNENDTVSVEELKFGDNDVLASLLAMLLEAEVLVMLTTSEGFMVNEKLQPHICEFSDDLIQHIEAHKIGLSSGGMKSKIIAASNMNHIGGLSVIASGLRPNILTDIFLGKEIGTLVGKASQPKAIAIPGRKRWIAFYNHSYGTITVDDGAKKALKEHGKSLLAVGILAVNGNFNFGSVIDVKDLNGRCFAKGLAQFSSQEINKIKGHDSEDIIKILGHKNYEEVIHRDNLVLLEH